MDLTSKRNELEELIDDTIRTQKVIDKLRLKMDEYYGKPNLLKYLNLIFKLSMRVKFNQIRYDLIQSQPIKPDTDTNNNKN